MNESGSCKPFRIISDVTEEDRPRWRVRTADNQLRGPLSDRGLRSLVEVGILTETASLGSEDSDDFSPICEHPIWSKIKSEKSELILKKTLTVAGSRPPMSVAPFSPGSTAPIPPTNPRAESVPPMREKNDSAPSHGVRETVDDAFLGTLAMRERQAQVLANEREKMARKFRFLRAANGVRAVRDLFVLGAFLALGDLLREGFADVLSSARWLLVFGVLLLAMVYYIFAALQD
jgi:hypothetical protein